MKKFRLLLLTMVLALAIAGCAKTDADSKVEESQEESVPEATEEPAAEPTPAPTEEPAATEAPAVDVFAKSEGVMTYAEYVAAEMESPVMIEAFVQAKQSLWEEKVTVYAQDKDGAYFIYNMPCTPEEYEKLTLGTKIKVNGYKTQWSGEVEIIDATFEIMEGNYVADAADVTDMLENDDIINFQNQFVAFKGMTVEAANDAGAAFLYKWDGSGQDGDDLYFNVSANGNTYSFTVETNLCDSTTDVYAAVKNLKVGDVIDMEGFLYWYEGVNPHITAVKVAEGTQEVAKSEGVMTYAEYVAAELETPVVIEAYVQAKQSWWEDTVTVYAQDEDGAYFIYAMPCSKEEYEKLTVGTKIKVSGYKTQWSGEVEIIDATYEILEGSFVAEPMDVTTLLGTEELINHQNEYVSFKGMTIDVLNDSGDAFYYKWDGSGQDGDDLYFNASVNGQSYTFTVETNLCDSTTDVYAAVKNLQVGDMVEMEGFLYWYEGANPHITSVKVVE